MGILDSRHIFKKDHLRAKCHSERNSGDIKVVSRVLAPGVIIQIGMTLTGRPGDEHVHRPEPSQFGMYDLGNVPELGCITSIDHVEIDERCHARSKVLSCAEVVAVDMYSGRVGIDDRGKIYFAPDRFSSKDDAKAKPPGTAKCVDDLQRTWIRRTCGVNRRPKRTPYRRPKGTPFVEQRDGYVGRTFRAGGGVGRA